jgi:hypothetical protein
MAGTEASVGSICTIVAAPWRRAVRAKDAWKGSGQPL